MFHQPVPLVQCNGQEMSRDADYPGKSFELRIRSAAAFADNGRSGFSLSSANGSPKWDMRDYAAKVASFRTGSVAPSL